MTTVEKFFVEDFKSVMTRIFRESYCRIIDGGISSEQALRKFNTTRIKAYSSLRGFDYKKGYQKMVSLAQKRYDKDSIVPKDILKWFLKEYNPPQSICQAFYSRNSDIFFKKYKYISHSGYYRQTRQNSIQLKLNKKHPTTPQWREFQRALSLVRPFPKMRLDNLNKLEECPYAGYKPFDILEYTLSEHGTYSLWVKNDVGMLIKTVYRREQKIYEGPLYEVFKHIHQNYYYE